MLVYRGRAPKYNWSVKSGKVSIATATTAHVNDPIRGLAMYEMCKQSRTSSTTSGIHICKTGSGVSNSGALSLHRPETRVCGQVGSCTARACKPNIPSDVRKGYLSAVVWLHLMACLYKGLCKTERCWSAHLRQNDFRNSFRGI